MSTHPGSSLIVTTRPIRLVFSLFAAAASVQLCAALKHFTIDASDLSTFASPLHHRCGRMMVLCCSWTLAEVSGTVAEALQSNWPGWTFGA